MHCGSKENRHEFKKNIMKVGWGILLIQPKSFAKCLSPRQYFESDGDTNSLKKSDWIQGYMYTLGRRGLRVSNSPVSSWWETVFLDMSASHCMGTSAWEWRQWATGSLAWATALALHNLSYRALLGQEGSIECRCLPPVEDQGFHRYLFVYWFLFVTTNWWIY